MDTSFVEESPVWSTPHPEIGRGERPPSQVFTSSSVDSDADSLQTTF